MNNQNPIFGIAIAIISLILLDLIIYLLLRGLKQPEEPFDGYVGFGFVMLFRRMIGKK